MMITHDCEPHSAAWKLGPLHIGPAVFPGLFGEARGIPAELAAIRFADTTRQRYLRQPGSQLRGLRQDARVRSTHLQVYSEVNSNFSRPRTAKEH